MEFLIDIETPKINVNVTIERNYNSISDAIDAVLIEFESQNYNLAIWEEKSLNLAELIFLTDTFEDMYKINIKQKKEKSDALLL